LVSAALLVDAETAFDRFSHCLVDELEALAGRKCEMCGPRLVLEWSQEALVDFASLRRGLLVRPLGCLAQCGNFVTSLVALLHHNMIWINLA
jgi:hypothetical protein